ncbi:hypothetical protein OUY22_34400 [Nonomuraea sp. MCN248]|uniref:WXG100 family type VII secretion target n=1 Tax=Nonomuraea corallina TaxID=2989783 RepID=A0ABT4SMQ7_9ACTN|nr:hypothetical protein [Nonomuraea corallina]MDA0638526.1 hypothetical protein [Nonomuraea corallina]
MRLWNGTEITKPVVDRGLAQWETMAEDLDASLADLTVKLKEALAAAPWGAGAEGRAFWSAHFQGDGPTRLIEQCAHLSKEISGESGRVRSAVDNTLAVDAAMKQDLSSGLRA